MELLFLAQLLPFPLDAGPKTRAYWTLRHLAAQHRVTLLAFQRAEDPPEALDALRDLCHAVITVPLRRSRWRDAALALRSLPRRTPWLIQRDALPAMRAAVQTCIAAQRFHAIHADQLWMAPYALAARAAAPTAPPALVLDQHNAVFQIPRRLAASTRQPLLRPFLAQEAWKLRRWERATCAAFDAVAWVTAEDRDALFPGKGEAAGPVIPICVAVAGEPPVVREPEPQEILFLGGLHWPPNAEGVAWLLHEVWPRVRAAHPQVRLTVIGKSPPAALAALAAADPRVRLLGYVEELAPHLARCAAFVVPLHAGGGMRVKIVDAWRWGLPIVSTRVGAEGVAARDGSNLLLADRPDEFAAALLHLLADRALAERLAAGGRQTAEHHYDWRRVYPAWDRLYARALAGCASHAGGI